MPAPTSQADATSPLSVLEELVAVERARIAADDDRRGALEAGVRRAMRRIADLGTPDAVLERAPAAIGEELDVDGVLLSRVTPESLIATSLWQRDGGSADGLPDAEPVAERLAYPLVEAEVVAAGAARLVGVERDSRRMPHLVRRVLGWEQYIVAPLAVEGATVGLLHAGRSRGPGLPFEAEVLGAVSRAAAELGAVLELSILRRMLRRHEQQLAKASEWLDARREATQDLVGSGDGQGPAPDSPLHALTEREREVMTLMAKGLTNPAIAAELVISEGTAKYHVKNILRKLGATNRADAVSRYVKARSGR